MSLFAHYPANPAGIVSQAESLMGASRGALNVGSATSSRVSAAAGQTDGVITSPVAQLDRPIVSDAGTLASAGFLAGGGLNVFAGAITTYNSGVDALNTIYEEAKANNFGVPAGGDAAAARVTLEQELRGREEALEAILDESATGLAGVLNGTAKSGSPFLQSILNFFGGGGTTSPFAGVSGTAEAETDDGGGLLGGLGDFLGGGSSIVADITGGIPGLGGLPDFGDVTDFAGDIGGGLLDFGGEVWDRGSTMAVYGWDTAVRRVTNPAQTAWDFLSSPVVPGSALLAEDLVAAEGILGEDGELYREGPYAGDAAYITGVSVPPGSDAITLGHTVRIGPDGTPDPGLIEHETQHVFDLEDVGTGPFYTSYLAEYAANLLNGDSQQEAYRNISWEDRAYAVGNDPNAKPEGIGGPASDVIDWVDGWFNGENW